MKNKSLNMLLMVLFGVGGIGTLAMAWGQPLSLSDRILPTFGGAMALVWVLILAAFLKLIPDKSDTTQVEVDTEDEVEDNKTS